MPDPARFDQCEIRRTPHHVACEVGEEKVVLQTNSGQYLGMNPVGAFIWDLLKTPRQASELVDQVMQRYDVDATTARADVDAFVSELSEAGLIDVQKL